MSVKGLERTDIDKNKEDSTVHALPKRCGTVSLLGGLAIVDIFGRRGIGCGNVEKRHV